MYALVDANSFYASAEKVFDPAIRNKPVVVLTNNDGCICALCENAKKLGVEKFSPYYKVKDLLAKNGAVVRSSNYELYDDLSNKMMRVVAQFAPEQHVYSIDECFLHFDSWTPACSWTEYATSIKQAVWQQLRLPVGVGLGRTPTLAKVASFAAKRLGECKGIAVLDTTETEQAVLQQLSVSEVWGVGKRISLRLARMGIRTAWQLASACPKTMRAHFSVELSRTITELRGRTCIAWDTDRAKKQQIYSTRAFGRPVTQFDDLRQGLAWHAEKVAEKLRRQTSGAKTLTLFAHANPFASSGHYHKAVQHTFTQPTSDTRALVTAATSATDVLYRQGVLFHKCGVGAIEIMDNDVVQQTLFSTPLHNPALMTCLDKINSRYGSQTIGSAAKGTHQPWRMKRDFLSPQYTTNWQHLPKINCRRQD